MVSIGTYTTSGVNRHLYDKWCQSALIRQVERCRLRIRYGAFALDTTIYFFRHRGRIFARPFSRVRITVYHFADILVYLLRNHICNILRIITVKIRIARQACDSTNVRKNTSDTKRFQNLIHVTHLLEFLTANAVTKLPNTWKTLRKNRFSHIKTSKKLPVGRKGRMKKRRNLPTSKLPSSQMYRSRHRQL